MRNFAHELLDLLLPPCCAQCAMPLARPAALCRVCWRALHPIPDQACTRCQVPLPSSGQRCADCADRAADRVRDPLDACQAAVWFEGQAGDWIHRFKYPRAGIRGLDAPARAVVTMLAEQAAARVRGPMPERVLPIPLHPRVVRRRGFNPAALLARHIARRRRVPWDPLGLVRTRDTQSQTALSRAERRRNVAGAFRAPHPLPARVWLVDDVVTTGATLCEAARAMRAAGAREVVAICAARTPAPDARAEAVGRLPAGRKRGSRPTEK